MSATNAIITRVKGTSTLVRPRFEPGMLLQHDDLEQLSAYTRELSRLMFRSLFGCGVVCGLVVKTERDKCGRASVVIDAGLALDGCGDPIHVPKDEHLLIDDQCDPALKPPLWVVLCRSTKNGAPRTAMCASDEEETASVCTRERAGYEIRLVRQPPKCICSCEQLKEEHESRFASDCLCVDPRLLCYRDHYAGKCGCSCDDCAVGSCDCDCVVLATLDRGDDENDMWTADHRVRRFVRPVLMRDPQVQTEKHAWHRRKEESDEAKEAIAAKVVAEKKSKPAKSAKATSADPGAIV